MVLRLFTDLFALDDRLENMGIDIKNVRVRTHTLNNKRLDVDQRVAGMKKAQEDVAAELADIGRAIKTLNYQPRFKDLLHFHSELLKACVLLRDKIQDTKQVSQSIEIRTQACQKNTTLLLESLLEIHNGEPGAPSNNRTHSLETDLVAAQRQLSELTQQGILHQKLEGRQQEQIEQMDRDVVRLACELQSLKDTHAKLHEDKESIKKRITQSKQQMQVTKSHNCNNNTNNPTTPIT